jgi:hypothetical protein
MSFAIDDAKVKELLENCRAPYELSGSAITPSIENYNKEPIYPDLAVGGTVPLGTREHLFALRRKIEKSGTSLIGARELEEEVREMRR